MSRGRRTARPSPRRAAPPIRGTQLRRGWPTSSRSNAPIAPIVATMMASPRTATSARHASSMSMSAPAQRGAHDERRAVATLAHERRGCRYVLKIGFVLQMPV
ncbi:MAG: hypothetical protein ACK55Z_10990, partial [bacterium]